MGWNSRNSVWFCSNKKRKKKDLLPKDLWEKKGEWEEERSATKWFVRKEEKKKKKKKMMWRCGGWSSSAGYYHRDSPLWNFHKRKSLMTDDCRLSNTALECDINKAMHAGSGGTWQWSFLEASLFINIPTHFFIYNKTPKFEYLYYDFFKTLY